MCFWVMYNVMLLLIPSQAVLLLLLVSSYAVEYNGECETAWPLTPRPHSVSVSEFGTVGDRPTLNTVAFQNVFNRMELLMVRVWFGGNK